MCAGATWAAVPITVENFSFEQPGLEKIKGWDGVCSDPGWTGLLYDIPGWSSDTAAFDSGVESDWPGSTEGIWSGFLMGTDPSVWNLVNYVIKAGDVLVLSVDARDNWTAPAALPAQLKMDLYYQDIDFGRVSVASNTVTLNETWTTYTLIFVANSVPGSIGKKIGIELKNASNATSTDNSWIGIDNVRLRIRWFGPFWFMNARIRLVYTPGWVIIPTGYWGGWYWWNYQYYWFYPWYGPVGWWWPYCYQYPYWAYWDYWPYYRYYHPWWHYWNWRGWPWFWGFNDRLTFRYWWLRPNIIYWWSYYWDPDGQGNCLELVTMSDESSPAGGRILPLDPNVISNLDVQSHQFSVNGGKAEGEFSSLEYVQVSYLEQYYRNIPGVTESDAQTFINSDIVKELMKNDPNGRGYVGVQYAQWQHPTPMLTVTEESITLKEGYEAEYSIGLPEPTFTEPVRVRVVSSKPERLLIRCPDGHWDVESFFDIYYEMPQTVTIKAVDDTFSEGEETIMLANFFESDPNNGFPLAVTIQDDECGGEGYHEADINHDCKVNFFDFAVMADGWLSCTDPGQ